MDAPGANPDSNLQIETICQPGSTTQFSERTLRQEQLEQITEDAPSSCDNQFFNTETARGTSQSRYIARFPNLQKLKSIPKTNTKKRTKRLQHYINPDRTTRENSYSSTVLSQAISYRRLFNSNKTFDNNPLASPARFLTHLTNNFLHPLHY